MTTIEGWEKDKAALMVKRGLVREVRISIIHSPVHPLMTNSQIMFPYVRIVLCGLVYFVDESLHL